MQIIQAQTINQQFFDVLQHIQKTGEKFIIEDGENHKKIAMLVPFQEEMLLPKERVFGIGQAKGGYKIHDDFAMSDEELLGLS